MSQEMRDVPVDVSLMPRLGRSPVALGAQEVRTDGLRRHPSMEDLVRRTLGWSPELQQAHAAFANYLRNSPYLPKRDREIAILRHAWDCGSDYQWGMHAILALDTGLTSEEIQRVALDPEDGGWAPHEVAIMRAVDDLHAACRVGDDAWARLSSHYDERQLIELLVLVGSYRLLAYVFSSVGIRPPNGESPDLPGNSFLFTAAESTGP
jgi:alkylhydroperoxidase family enzyme